MNDSDEEFIAEDEAENPALVVKRLRERLNKAEAERAEYLDGWQRSRADFANLKKDEQTQRQRTEERLKVSLAEEIIPVLDGFEMAFKSPSFAKGDSEWKKGIEGLYNQLSSALKRFGINSYRATEGLAFDPTRHEAVREVPGRYHGTGSYHCIGRGVGIYSWRLHHPAGAGVGGALRQVEVN